MFLLTTEQTKQQAVSDDVCKYTKRFHSHGQRAHHDSIESDLNKGDDQGHLLPGHAAANQRPHKGTNADEYHQ